MICQKGKIIHIFRDEVSKEFNLPKDETDAIVTELEAAGIKVMLTPEAKRILCDRYSSFESFFTFI